MKSKLFLGIILIVTILSSMLITITEGVCNYNDGGGISGNQGGSSYSLAVGTKYSRGKSDITDKIFGLVTRFGRS